MWCLSVMFCAARSMGSIRLGTRTRWGSVKPGTHRRKIYYRMENRLQKIKNGPSLTDGLGLVVQVGPCSVGLATQDNSENLK